jgi:hypothetical protein
LTRVRLALFETGASSSSSSNLGSSCAGFASVLFFGDRGRFFESFDQELTNEPWSRERNQGNILPFSGSEFSFVLASPSDPSSSALSLTVSLFPALVAKASVVCLTGAPALTPKNFLQTHCD